MRLIFTLLVISITKLVFIAPTSYKILSATAWNTTPISGYPDFSASLTPIDYLPSIFQYTFNDASTVFTCTTHNCSEVRMVPMPGLAKAQFAYGGVSPRRIQQESPIVGGAQFFLSTGYATPNRDTELVVCQSDDRNCTKPQISNTADCSGFGQTGLRLTFTRPDGLPIMLIPEARYASRDNRVTGYIIEACTDPLCRLARSRASLPFNLTGTANCLGTSIDVALNRFGFPSWLTLCDEELNLIHCLTPSCNQTSVSPFKVNRNLVYFVHLAVDSYFRFVIATTEQAAQSDISYIRCLDPDCTNSVQSQLRFPTWPSSRSLVSKVQVVFNPLTNLPIFHVTGSIFPSGVSVYKFVICQDIDCDMSQAIFIDYGGTRFKLDRSIVDDLFIDNQGIATASIRTIYLPTNETINVIVRMGLTDDPDIDRMTFVQPSLLN